MKNILCLSLLSAAVAGANPADYVNFVRQIQNDSGVEWDVSVAPTGSMLSPEGVGPTGSLFQLWSIHSQSASEYHLDEEFVSVYTPSATITIVTGDPYAHIARTRVDQPFSVQVEVAGLLPQTGSPKPPLSASQALLSHDVGEYPEGQHSFGNSGQDPATEDPYRNVGSAILTSNGTIVLNYSIMNLAGDDPTKIEGEEVWKVFSLDGGEDGIPLTEGEVLESAKLQVWPIADAVISGIDSTVFYETVPSITVTLRDLYPDSTTNLRVYGGAPNPNIQADGKSDIQSSFVIIQDSIPQDRVLTLGELDGYFPTSGDYTIEVVHQTPFGTEVLDTLYPVNIRRTIHVRASVYSSE